MDKTKPYEGIKYSDFREVIEHSATLYGDKTAFIYKKNPKDSTYMTHTYQEFKFDINALGTALLNLGLEGKRVAVIAPNRYEWCVGYFAVTTGNMIIVPLDKSLPDNEIESSIIRSKVEAVIFDEKYTEVFQKLRTQNSSNLKYYICMDSISDNSLLSYTALIQEGKDAMEKGDTRHSTVALDAEGMTIMLFTSGTTSLAKIVALSQKNICANLYSIGCLVQIYDTDTFLSFLPLHHTFESSTTFLFGISSGARIAFCDGLKYIVKNLEEYQVSCFVCVPLMLEAMYKKIAKGIKETGKEGLVSTMQKISGSLLKIGIDIRRTVFKSVLAKLGGHLRLIVYGAAPMDKNTIIGLSSFGINMVQGYGLTETSPVIAGENYISKRPGSVGFALPTVEIKIDQPDEKGVGEIIAKGPNVMLGYYENSEATSEVLKGGWFYTGDLGYFDEDGYLFVTGRKKNVIVLKNGKNVFPEELEILISRLPYVEENMVYGKPDSQGDYTLCVKVVYNKDIISEHFKDVPKENYHDVIWQDIKDINKTMPAYKYIRELIITEEPMIKTTTQKIKRHEEIKKILGE